ncbi:MAG: response regulator, partial [Alphaproteobacteria bacterium]
MAVLKTTGSNSFTVAEQQARTAAAYVTDRETEQQLKDLLPKWGYISARIERGSVPDAIRHYRDQTMPDVLIVDISKSSLPLSDLQALADISPPNVQVVALGLRDNVGLYRDLMEIGVTDYLVKPVPSELLYKAVARASGQMSPQKAEPRAGKTVSVLGVRGGVGATSLVFNTGWLLAHEFSRHVMLSDLNLANGSLALEIGIEANSGLADLLSRPERIDKIFIDRATLSASDRLKVLVSECDLTSARPFDGAAMTRLTEELRNRYHFILQDLDRSPPELCCEILRKADVRLLVMDAGLASLRDCARYLELLEEKESGQKTLIVLNCVRKGTGDVHFSRIEKYIGREIDFFIPFEKRRM